MTHRQLFAAVSRRARSYGPKLVRRLQSTLLSPPNTREAGLISELRQELAGLDPLPEAGEPLENVWRNYRQQFRRLFTERDPRAFLKWELTRQALYNAGPLREELRDVRALPDWDTRWRGAVRESAVGRPDRCPEWPETSWNLIRHAFVLSHFERASGRQIDEFELIIEFGGGYGSMARLAWQLGFRGHYVVYDLPEMCAVQRYFLKSIGLPTSNGTGVHDGPRVSWASSTDELRNVTRGEAADLFLATWSLSETPISFRTAFLETIEADHFLFVYANRYRGVDNSRFFKEWQEQQSEFRWFDKPSPHQRGRTFSVGVRGSLAAVRKPEV